MSVIHALQSDAMDYSPYGAIVEDCKNQTSLIDDVSFTFVKRSGNMLAHTLARRSNCFQFFRCTLPDYALNMVLCNAIKTTV